MSAPWEADEDLQILDVLPAPVDQSCVRERVGHQQRKSKHYTDAKRNAKYQLFLPGDQVRVRKPWTVKKGEQKFTPPMTVVRQKSPHTYLLDDGRMWNASHLSSLSELNSAVSMHGGPRAMPNCRPMDSSGPKDPETRLPGPKTMFWVRP